MNWKLKLSIGTTVIVLVVGIYGAGWITAAVIGVVYFNIGQLAQCFTEHVENGTRLLHAVKGLRYDVDQLVSGPEPEGKEQHGSEEKSGPQEGGQKAGEAHHSSGNEGV